MKISKPTKGEEIRCLLDYFAKCHDASLRKICFKKNREFDENGNLVYPFNDVNESVNCDIEIEMLLNSYTNARKDQVVLFGFKNVKAFNFMQEEDFDYSDIYEVKFRATDVGYFNFVFSTKNGEREVLNLYCRNFVSKEI